MKTVFLRVLEAEDKAVALFEAVRDPKRARGQQRFQIDPKQFAKIPGSPFAYWVNGALIGLFERHPTFLSEERTAMVGASTKNDERYVRAWHEVSSGRVARDRDETRHKPFVSFVKGGRRSLAYSDVNAVVDWCDDGGALKADISEYRGSRGWGYQWSAALNGHDWYFRPCITWPLRGVRFSGQVVPAGCIFSVGGKAAFAPMSELLHVLGVFNSAPFDALIALRAGKVGGVQYEAGLIQATPYPEMPAVSTVAMLARTAWSLKRSLDTSSETSHAFTLPALLHVAGTDVAARGAAWSEHVRTGEADFVAIQAGLDERCFALYGIDEADRLAITEGFGTRASEEGLKEDTNDAEDDADEDTDESEATADVAVLAAELVSWSVGIAFGRFDIRLATGARPMPPEPEPFDPLPACSPGMLTGDDGLPLARPPAGYPLAFPENGVLVDDLGHAQDLPTAVRAVFDVVFGADADRWWNDVAALLDPKGNDLRAWLAGSFFEHHLKRHSKSRRKAPILWQLGTPSGRYSVWLYAHRLTRDSFFQLQNEVVGPKLAHEERQLTSLMQNPGGSPSAKERKENAAQEAVVEELRAMQGEVKRVAPLWSPNLDDGVVLTMAPLYRLVPQYKPWQKELKTKWDELSAGKYDWAHLALHLWPERVVPKCATDRSLAIAHGLEDVFWIEDSAGKWKPRAEPARPIEELVRERSSPAVKAALKSLLEAPAAAGTGKRAGSRKSRQNHAGA